MSENVSDKTCGKCKHHGSLLNLCCRYADADYPGVKKGCKNFEPKVITYGDVIRQMSNEELAIEFVTITDCGNCDDCPVKDYCTTECCDPIPAWIAYLNAPAACVKQNGNHDTQTDLCKADNTESEGEDE